MRCGIALYGISPFGDDPAADGLEPALRWDSFLALVKRLEPGREHGLRPSLRRGRPTWIGIVPVGYADGFRRDMTGTEILSPASAAAWSGRSRWTRSRSSCRRSSPWGRP